MQKIILSLLFLSTNAFALDFSLRTNGPCGMQPCTETCEYTLNTSGARNTKLLVRTEYSLKADGTVESQVRFQVPSYMDIHDIFRFGNDGHLRDYYTNQRQYVGRAENKWLRVHFDANDGIAGVIKATSLADFAKSRADAQKNGATPEQLAVIAAQERFAQNHWPAAKFGSNWITEFDASQPTPRPDMGLPQIDYETYVGPFYFNMFALRFLPAARVPVVYFTGGKSKPDHPNTIRDEVLGQASGDQVQWRSQFEFSEVKANITSQVSQQSHAFSALSFTAKAALGSIDAKLAGTPSCRITR